MDLAYTQVSCNCGANSAASVQFGIDKIDEKMTERLSGKPFGHFAILAA
jgi:hypothetical protein